MRLLDFLVAEALRRMVLGSLADMLHALLQTTAAEELVGMFGSHLYATHPAGGPTEAGLHSLSSTQPAALRSPSSAARAGVSQAPPLPLAGERALLPAPMPGGPVGGASPKAGVPGIAGGPAAPADPLLPVLRMELLLQEAGSGGGRHQRDALVFEPRGDAFQDALAGLRRRMLGAAADVPRLLLDARLQVRGP